VGTAHIPCGDGWLRVSATTLEQVRSAPANEQIALNSPDPRFTGNASVVLAQCERSEGARWRRFIWAAGGGGTSPGDRSVLCFDGHAYLIVGQYVACLATESGDLAWARQCDDSLCFGIHRMPSGDAIIVHGELEVVRLALDGTIRWRAGARDIFTGPFNLLPDSISATDFNGDVYRIDYETGASIIVGHSTPFPH
jgi:hypothetical protein